MIPWRREGFGSRAAIIGCVAAVEVAAIVSAFVGHRMSERRPAAAAVEAGERPAAEAPVAAASQDRKQAPGRCSAMLQAFYPADFTDSGYQQKVYQRVAGAWKRPAESPRSGSKTVVITEIGKDGRATAPLLHMKSGSDAWDAAALGAVKAAMPFEPLPSSYAHPSIQVHFHFTCSGS